MALPLALAIGSTALSFMGSMSAAKAAKREAAMRARQIQQQKQAAQLTALQEHNNRLSNLQVFLGTNEALAGTMGRDLGSDRSLKALIEKAKKDVQTDADRARVQFAMEQGKLSFQQNMALEKGKNLARGYRFQAIGTLLSGAYKTSQLTTPSAVKPTYYGNTFDRAF